MPIHMVFTVRDGKIARLEWCPGPRAAPSPPRAAPDLETLEAVQRRVLWLATAIVHHANRVRENRSGVKVGGHQASSASMVSLMTALWFSELRAEDRVSVKPHASPVLHAINYLLGRLERPYLESLRAFGGLQSYPSRTKDPDPVDYSTGSVGIGATAPIWGAIARRYLEHHRFEAPPRGRQIALLGDAELDEGAVWEAIADPWVARLGEVLWVVDLNRQSLDRVVPDIAFGRLAGMFEAAGWQVLTVKYGRRLEAPVRARAAARTCGAASTRCRTRSTSACCAPTRRSCASGCPGRNAGLGALVGELPDDELRARLPRPRRPRHRQADRGLPGGAARPPDGDLRLHDQGLVAADRGAPGEPLGAAHARAVRGAGEGSSAPTRTTRGRRSTPAARRASWPPRPPPRSRARSPSRARRPRCRPRSAASTAGKESTQQAFGRFFVDLVHEAPEVAERVVTVSPDVASSTNLGGWINKSGIWSVGERRDWFADDSQTLVHWHETTGGRHIELGIAETNLVGLLGELGATWSRHGQPLLPIGTIYDPFVGRALEPWSFGIYAGGQSILIGTPSGVSLAPEGGAHQSIVTPSIGIGQPGCTFWEPAFGQDLEWTLLHAALAPRPAGRRVGLLPPLHAADRPVARGRATARTSAASWCSPGGYPLRRAKGTPAVTLAGHGRGDARGAARRRHARRRRRGDLRDERRPPPRAPSGPAPASASTRRRSSTSCSPPTARRRWSPCSTATRTRSRSSAAVNAVPLTPLGVTRFGQSGDLDDVYRHHEIDAETIVGAALDLLG